MKFRVEGIYDAKKLGIPQMLILGLQHMFAMFGATILVPILVNNYFHGEGLSIQVTLFCAGFGTLLFHVLTKLKVPAFLGSSFAFLGGFATVAELDTGIFANMSYGEKLPYACGGVFVAGLIILTIEQQKLVNLTKEINPEKKGSIYDVKFQKKWEASCDEAELFAIYKSAYRSYCITQRLCIILWLFCIIGGFVWGFGAVPVLLVSIIWGTMITSYSYYAIHLSN